MPTELMRSRKSAVWSLGSMSDCHRQCVNKQWPVEVVALRSTANRASEVWNSHHGDVA